jgi:hypothetical protein
LNKELTDEKFFKQRQERTLPVLDAFKKWLDKKHTVPTSLLDKAVSYTFNQWGKLTV